MQVAIDSKRWWDWEIRHTSQIPDGAVSRPTPLGDELKQVRVEYDTPTTTVYNTFDADIDRMVQTHREGVKNATEGYWAVHEGAPGPDGRQHGDKVWCQKAVPEKTAAQIIAEHLQLAMTNHCAPADVTAVRIVEPHQSFTADDTERLTRYLQVVLSGGALG